MLRNLCILVICTGYLNGIAASNVDTCYNNLPIELNTTAPMDTPCPFSTYISKEYYVNGVRLPVVIDAVEANQRHRLYGLYIQARSTQHQTNIQGRFYQDTNTAHLTGIVCPNRNTQYEDGYGYSLIQSVNYFYEIPLPLTLYWMTRYYVETVHFQVTFVYLNGSLWEFKSSDIYSHKLNVAGCSWDQHNCGNNLCKLIDTPCPKSCTNGTFACGSTFEGCIAQSKVCDGTIDCVIGYKDENSTVCGYACDKIGQVKCPYSSKCIDSQRFCDGQDDCGHFLDEYNCDNVCGGNLTEQNGYIIAPLEPGTANYKLNARCRWTIQAPVDHRIMIIFINLVLEKSSICLDKISLYDKTRLSKLGELCNSIVYKRFDSTTNILIVEFLSDISVNDKPWEATYRQYRTGPDIKCNQVVSMCSNGFCKGSPLGQVCDCEQGYKHTNSFKNDCSDIDECDPMSGRSVCSNGQCANTKGSYYCECNTGYDASPTRKQCLKQCNQFQKKCSDLSCVGNYNLCHGEICPPIDHFTCDGGSLCLPNKKKCDYLNQCTDGSDEAYCIEPCREREFMCVDQSKCLPLKQKCDGRRDCADGSDELMECPRTCPERMYRCGSGLCLPARYICDGVFDCPSKQDEHESTCYNGGEFFTCDDGQRIAARHRCEETWHCRKGEDEMNCGGGLSKSSTDLIITMVFLILFIISVVVIISRFYKKRQQARRGRPSRALRVTENPISNDSSNTEIQGHNYLAGSYAPGSYIQHASPRIFSHRNHRLQELPPETLPPDYEEVMSTPQFQRPAKDVITDEAPAPAYDSLPEGLKHPPLGGAYNPSAFAPDIIPTQPQTNGDVVITRHYNQESQPHQEEEYVDLPQDLNGDRTVGYHTSGFVGHDELRGGGDGTLGIEGGGDRMDREGGGDSVDIEALQQATMASYV